ncbi:MAG: PilW family protein [Hyphomicrobiales bacterium]
MRIRHNKGGFTLVELMVAMAIATIVLASIYAAFNAQMRRYTTEQQVVEMQQNIRAAMYLLKRDIRVAGYSPVDPPVSAGFVADFVSFGAPHDGCGAVTDATDIAFTMDTNENGAIDSGNSFELIAYRHDPLNMWLERYDAATGTWQRVAEKIQSITFTYRRADDSVIATPVTGSNLQDIRYVNITIQATSGQRTMQLSDKVKCRNIGI